MARPLNTPVELAEELRQGRPVILVDDEDRENEGDVVLAADFVTPEAINFMAKEARGLICLTLTSTQCQRLGLPPMVHDDVNHSPNRTAFTVSIEARAGVSTGISAADRAHTIRVASRTSATSADIIMPGHIFPIRAQEGGVLKRAGHTEGSIDLMRLAGLNPAAVICEVMNDDGTMARFDDLALFAEKHRMKMGSIVDLIRFRLQNETLVEEVASARLPSIIDSEFRVRAFRNRLDGSEHLVLQKGVISADSTPLVRVHSECMTGDVFGSLRCDCGAQLKRAMQLISEAGHGAILYLRQEGRGIGLGNKIRAYELQDQGYDTVDANTHLGFPIDARDYGIGAQILRLIGLHRIRLLTNNPAKRVGLKGYGIEIVERLPLIVGHDPQNRSYMETKRKKLGHLLDDENKDRQ